MTRKRLSLLLVCVAASTALPASQAAWISGKVVGSAAADGSGADAPKYSGVSIVRNNIPGELAIQVAGPDATDPSRIFSPLHKPAYYLTDAGSQWVSGLSTGQVVLAVVETMKPNHTWGGEAYAAAVSTSITKAQLISGMIEMPDLTLSLIPKPSLASADPSHISLSINAYADLEGTLHSLSIWRRSYGQNLWDFQATVANPNGNSSTLWNDLAVSPENLYEYAVSLNFNWPGGSGAGSLTSTTGIFSTQARAYSGPFAASLKQPTPTPTPAGPTATVTPFELPQGWLAYPNPVHGDTLSIAFDAPGAGHFEISAFTLGGELARVIRGTAKPGRNMLEMGIKSLASGIYLVRINIEGKDGLRLDMPTRKIAVLK